MRNPEVSRHKTLGYCETTQRLPVLILFTKTKQLPKNVGGYMHGNNIAKLKLVN